MILLKGPRALLSLVLICSAALAFAQIGDNADKPGAPQVPLVPAYKIPPAPTIIERLVVLKAAQPPRSRRSLALLDGMIAGANGSPRPLRFAQEPDGWFTLTGNPALATRVGKLHEIVVWPGKTGLAAIAAVTRLTTEQQARFEIGKTLFTTICAACHQFSGHGLDGAASPLLDSEWVLGTHECTVRIALHGVRGPIKVANRMHRGYKPAHGDLDDQQISSILTYVQREWGHDAPPVDPAHVGAIRASTKNHFDA
jgi:mono/diheme cytochrome c family protein